MVIIIVLFSFYRSLKYTVKEKIEFFIFCYKFKTKHFEPLNRNIFHTFHKLKLKQTTIDSKYYRVCVVLNEMDFLDTLFKAPKLFPTFENANP